MFNLFHLTFLQGGFPIEIKKDKLASLFHIDSLTVFML